MRPTSTSIQRCPVQSTTPRKVTGYQRAGQPAFQVLQRCVMRVQSADDCRDPARSGSAGQRPGAQGRRWRRIGTARRGAALRMTGLRPRQQPAGRIGSTLPPVRRLARCRRRGVRATCILDPLTRETRNGTGKEEACRQENHFCQAGQEDGKWQKAPQVRRHPAAEGGVPNFDASRGLTTLASKSRPAASAWRDLRFAARRLDRSSGAMRNQEAGRAQPNGASDSGHEQSSGLCVPGKRPRHKPWARAEQSAQ